MRMVGLLLTLLGTYFMWSIWQTITMPSEFTSAKFFTPVVKSVQVDVSKIPNVLIIHGENYDTNSTPKVTLSDDNRGFVFSVDFANFSSTHIVATLMTFIPDGDYLLTITMANPKRTALSYRLIIGPVDSQWKGDSYSVPLS